ncbi:beta-N-acetylhexosaminidase [Flagellimonas zhangzhouensis]|uniref:beta-N-acetylhexosaminidase n=1 Tax=Flagellimonas zhangzhouensis TaxID=1073328 RepID=A0A1H2QZ25_9FLAO|nr:family 20 glycosylhydrolase [Allomuricauda zhangzhouensis]SDQ58089.1 hexosaminidase [Allomuricauda zhangzhouensis]SDW12335.1 hexosaminidase [Allomuricauda zhangzhouensis]
MIKKSILLFTAVLCIAACEEQKKEINFPKTDLSAVALIPKPVKTIPTNSAFGLGAGTAIYTSTTDPEFEKVGQFLSEKIKGKTGLDLGVNSTTENTLERLIYINQSDSEELDNPEAYQLYIKKDSILLNAKTAAGAFRGIQTLRQLIPEQSNDTLTDQPLWVIPSGKIMDAPKLAYRSSMLDVARHFFTVDEVKKYIDILAYYKYNTLHMHLTDDQGWRIEIKSWPKLTEVGGQSEVGGGEGGFYSQEEYKDIVAYAAERHIQIVPEMDMPGHTNSASLSYPFLHAAGQAETPRVRTDMKVGYSSFDAQKDTVYSFLDDVIGEIASMSPSPYFHIGGDESHVTKKSDYILFVEKVEKIVQKHGKIMIGWDEIAQAKIDGSSIVQLWNEPEHALKAAENGSKIIISPAKKAYLDMQYDSISEYGLHWAAYIPVDVGYQWDPETYVEGLPKENILGIEAPLWSETISNSAELEYLAFPRAIGYAELGWTSSEQLNWDDYKERLAKQVPYLEKMNVNYYPSKLIDWKKE